MIEDRDDDSPSEVELKLTGDPAALKALREAGALTGTSGRLVTHRLESVYYDTPDHRLHRRKLAFRVRRKGRRFIQTLKDEGDGMLRRGEWEAPVASLDPDLDALPAPEPRHRVGLMFPGELNPVFASRIRRSSRVLKRSDGNGHEDEIEIAFDDGIVVADDRSEPVAELELELLHGSPKALYDLALELTDLVPLKFETRSKSARGYALAGAAPEWRKAVPLVLDRAATGADVLEAIVRNCMSHWLANEAAALDGSEPEGVHQMRVGLRRLRSALSLLAKAIPAEQLSWLQGETRWIAGSLGPARDWDVFLASLLPPVAAARPDDSSLPALRSAAEAMRASAYDHVNAAIATPRYTRFVLSLGAWLEGEGWRDGATGKAAKWQAKSVVELADHVLGRQHRKVLKLGDDFARLPTEQRHRVRIALKKLRYAAEFFRGLYPKRRALRYGTALAGLQDSIGHLNDVAVAARLMDELNAELPAGADPALLARGAGTVIGWHEHGVTTLEPRLVADWDAFAATRPFWHQGG
ncbi:MAG: CYTH and CHAD domain-containing protein [Inquilinus sp.]|nr:CYTH and CHAD domain-containing protein [Inquilinus sp.]